MTRFLPIVGALLATACVRHASGPGGVSARFAINPLFSPAGGAAAAGIVDIARTRVRLEHADGSPALDSVIIVPAGADSVTLLAQVTILTLDEPLALTVAFVTPTGDTAFRGGPVSVRPGPGTGPPVPVNLPTVYVGVGANAIGVIIGQRAASVLVGDSVTLTAQAYDAQQQPIPGTPIAWTSLDSAFAIVPDPAVGTVVGAGAGTARLVASLLTGPADTIAVSVTTAVPGPAR